MKRILLGILLLTSAASAQPSVQVFAGRDGYVFFTTELLKTDYSVTSKTIANLALVNKVFKDHGINVVFTIVPTKISVLPNYVTTLPSGSVLNPDRYNRFLSEMTADGLNVFDLRGPLVDYQRSGNYSVWFYKDTHWSPMGAFAAGVDLAKYVKLQKLDTGVPTETFTYAEKVIQHTPDFLRIAPKDFADLYTPTEKVLVPVVTKKEEGLLDPSFPSVALFGTSFSNLAYGGFASGLKTGLSEDLLNNSDDGGGVWRSASTFLNYDQFKKSPPKLIIWEVPERLMETPEPEGGIQPYLQKLEAFLQH